MRFPDQFICAGLEYSTREREVPAPMFRRAFFARKGEMAELIITGLGFYDVWLNGSRLTKGMLAPYINNPDHFVFYDRYDVSNELRDGENVLSAVLGNGFWNNQSGVMWDFQKAGWVSAARMALSLEITSSDGATRTVLSDEEFRCAPSPIVKNDLRWGEVYDARREIPGWKLAGFNDSGWKKARLCDAPKGEKRLCECAPVVISREIAPVAIVREGDGWRYDFGENVAGVCRLDIDGVPGQRVDILHGEMITNGKLDVSNIKFEAQTGPDDDIQRDVYICKGGREVYQPRFTYHGFRYALVTGISARQALPGLLTCLVMHSAGNEIGGFNSSDPVADRLFHIVRVSDLGNFVYFPTDCPQREKNGWTADASLSCEHMLMNLDVSQSLKQWLLCIRAAQAENGALPGIIPTDTWGYSWGNGPAWDSVLFELPYRIYQYRGDRDVLRDNAEAMRKYLKYAASRAREDGLIAFGLGDWCPVGHNEAEYKAPVEFTDTVLVSHLADQAAYMFGEIGLGEYRDEAIELRDRLTALIRGKLIDFDTLTAAGNCQTTQAMALYYGVFEGAGCKAAFERLLEMISENGGHMDCGVLGGRVLFHVLARFGQADLAYDMITRKDFPSYGHWLEQGATSLWERFLPEPQQCGSLNHHFWGDIANWFMSAVAGLYVNPDRSSPDHIDIRPSFVKKLDYAQAWHDAPSGRAVSSWARNGDRITLSVKMPKTVHGQMLLPTGWVFEDGSGRKPAVTGDYTVIMEI